MHKSRMTVSRSSNILGKEHRSHFYEEIERAHMMESSNYFWVSNVHYED